MNKALEGALGISIRSRRVSIGTQAVREAIRSSQSSLVLMREDVSASSIKAITNSTDYYKVELIIGDFAETFENITRKTNMIVISINDKGLADLIKSKL